MRPLTPKKSPRRRKEEHAVSFGKTGAKVDESVAQKRQEFEDVFQSILAKAGDLKSETMEQYAPAPLLAYKRPRKPIRPEETFTLRIPEQTEAEVEGDRVDAEPPSSPFYTDKAFTYTSSLESEAHDSFKAPPKSAYAVEKPLRGIDRKEEERGVKKKLSDKTVKELRESFQKEMRRFHQTSAAPEYKTEYAEAFTLKGEQVEPTKKPHKEALTEYQESFKERETADMAPRAGITQSKATGKRPSRKTFPSAFEPRETIPTAATKAVYATEYDSEFVEPAKMRSGKKEELSFQLEPLLSEYQQRFCAPDGGVGILNPAFLHSPKPKPFKVAEPFSEYQVEFDHCDVLNEKSRQASVGAKKASSTRAATATKAKQGGLSPRKAPLTDPTRHTETTTLSQPARNFAEWWNKNGRQMWTIMNPLTRFQRYKPFANLLKTPRSEYMEAFR